MSEGIRLTGLRVRGRHGVFDFEKRDGQDFLVDLHVRADTSAAQRSDDLADTVDYGALAERAAAIVAGPPFDLIEALAAAIAEDLLAECDDVEVTVHKPQAPIERAFADVSVTVRRRRAAGAASCASAADRPGAAVLSLGSNVGDPAGAIEAALTALDRHPRLHVLARSGLYATAPQGGVEQPDFVNTAALVAAEMPARELLRVCQGIELALGRTREVRWGPRTLDIDLVRFTPEAPAPTAARARGLVPEAPAPAPAAAGPAGASADLADPGHAAGRADGSMSGPISGSMAESIDVDGPGSHNATATSAAATPAVDAGVDAPEAELASADPELLLPHPRAHDRAFVLVPWLELRPHAALAVPGRGEVPAAVLASELAGQGVRRLPDGEAGA
ncbi:2-amino-4-hydroxy-6-hydroxymethyldihydropteridine diphosphokinase [Brevibacterium sp. 5221]|uniref:Bifunctional folate synthesis protein n=1 Tax=Brevibacterium rongguiense TaxID=2695267 RepID=A0A6N9HBB8_9MICO|nr:2-amino-4-hydroxy-6-hydroxymethyldihydropteridine diphosphokinase [Brevibacterium rongguiense]MYM20862.1 2-amino-4-hydroxy-6-hydroxymethyldihydropteridine diphosphokinase [Brevibacterium rongguiense]